MNHFPNHYELTRKDLMYKNVKRYRRVNTARLPPVEHGDLMQSSTGISGSFTRRKDLRKQGFDDSRLDFVPTTFILPQDYSLFLEEHRKGTVNTWIFKPHGRAQGRGIFLVCSISIINAIRMRSPAAS